MPIAGKILSPLKIFSKSSDRSTFALRVGHKSRTRTNFLLDRTTKASLYALSGIRELWIVDLNVLAIEVLRSPSPDGYQDVRILQKGQSFAFQAFPDAVLTVEQLLVGFP